MAEVEGKATAGRRARRIQRRTAAIVWPAILTIVSTAVAAVAAPPMMIERQGSFSAGGRVLGDPGQASLSCDHGFMEFQIPVHARRTALILWHSSSTAAWQNRWDGGEGYQSIFLRRGFPVYLWDGPRVGRANWGCADVTYKATLGRDQQNFVAWRFGTKYPDFFPGVQFPTKDLKAYDQAMRARYDEFDTPENALLQADAAAKAIDQVGPSVLVTNSAGGWRALLAALKTDKVRGIVAYENPGYVFPDGQGPQRAPGPMGPIHVPLGEFKRLTRFPIQFVWGDNIDKSKSWPGALDLCRQFVEIVNANGGHAEILQLPSVGLKGNTHLPFADLNNVAVADQLSLFLKRNKLDQR
jgi:hypothetical protein